LQNNHGESFKPDQESFPEVVAFAPGTVFEFGGKRYTFDGNGLRINDYATMLPEEWGEWLW